jgi:hypothetical protein
VPAHEPVDASSNAYGRVRDALREVRGTFYEP